MSEPCSTGKLAAQQQLLQNSPVYTKQKNLHMPVTKKQSKPSCMVLQSSKTSKLTCKTYTKKNKIFNHYVHFSVPTCELQRQ